jgi:CheY-like chemotaxis protein
MKVGLLADVRGALQPLQVALGILREEGCEQVACLGSTAEGGPEDAAVLEALRGVGAVILPSPHDAPGAMAGLAGEAAIRGLTLAHAVPGGLPADEILWTSGVGAPWLLAVTEHFRGSPGQRASGDLYAPVLYSVPASGPPRRRTFAGPDAVRVPEGSFLTCPGSVSMAVGTRRGGSVMTWDEGARELVVVPFTERGRREVGGPLARIIVYCDDFGPHRPDEDVLRGVDLVVRESADDIVADHATLHPDLILMDYHLAGKLSGLDGVIALQSAHRGLPVPVFTIAGNPADNLGMKSAGAVGSLPFTYLKDALTRLILEATG